MFDKTSKKMLKTCDSKTLSRMVMKPAEIDSWLEKNPIALGVKTGEPIVMMCENLFG